MKYIKYITLTLLLTVGFSIESQAKYVKTPHLYMFGFSASFSDSTIYVTDIQDVEGAWIDTKSKFLMGRDNYSYQLKEYLADKLLQPNRVCMVFFATNKAKAEKKMKKLMKKYIPNPKKKKNLKPYEVRYLNVSDFKFSPIEMTNEE